MAFRLPANLTIDYQFQVTEPGDVAAMESALAPYSRMLVGLALDEVYDGFVEDCEQADIALREAGVPAWPEYDRLTTADPDGEPVVWVSYLSTAENGITPQFWTTILLILGGIGGWKIFETLSPVWGGTASPQPDGGILGSLSGVIPIVILLVVVKMMFGGGLFGGSK